MTDDLAKDVRAEQARAAWFEAVSEFQRRCPDIKKTSSANIATAKGFYSYKYAPLDEIMATTRPLLGELGLSIYWSSPAEAPVGKVVCSCRVAHVLGHVEESGQVCLPVPDASDRSGGNPLQRIGSALSYARRYSLMSILGISPEDDDDAETVARKPEKKLEEDVRNVPVLPDTPSVDTWRVRYDEAQTMEGFGKLENMLSPEWSRYDNEEKVVLKMIRDKTKVRWLKHR